MPGPSSARTHTHTHTHRGRNPSSHTAWVELGDRLVGCVGGDHRGRGEAVTQTVEELREVRVERVARTRAHGVVGMGDAREPDALE